LFTNGVSGTLCSPVLCSVSFPGRRRNGTYVSSLVHRPSLSAAGNSRACRGTQVCKAACPVVSFGRTYRRVAQLAEQRSGMRILRVQPLHGKIDVMPMPKKERPLCLNCHKPTVRATQKFCSNRCQAELTYRQWVEDWLTGSKSGLRGNVATSKFIRRYLRETHGEQCALCGWAEKNMFTGLIPLHIDHIDGNYANNRPENLRFLCPNCHALTSTYGSLNRGSGRPFFVKKK
jgi:endogenous inhibitor of DNA gyrase (YacG/DUF329 family)